MAEVVELRVHGVGGTPPQDLLGEPRPGGLVRVGGDGKSAFFGRVRDGRLVEGYAWGPLTSSGLVQPLWIFLLPFTLLNVAGWMLPPRAKAWHPSIWSLARGLIALLGVGLTLDYLYGLSVLITRQLMFEWAAPKWVLTGPTAIWIGTGIVAAIGVLVFIVAVKKQRQFEAVRNPIDRVGPRRARKLLPPGQDGLGDRDFWTSGRFARRFLVLHVIFAAGALAWFAWKAFTQIDEGLPQFDWRPAFFWAGTAQLLLLGLLAFVLLVGFRQSWRWFLTGHFRILGPYVAITTAIGLSSGLLVGMSLILKSSLGLTGALEVDLGLAFGTSTISFVLTGVLVILFLLGRSARIARSIRRTGNPPEDESPPGEEPSGYPRRTVKKIATARAFSEFGRNVDLILTVPALVFTAVIASSYRLDDLQEVRPNLLVVAVLVASLMFGTFFAGARSATFVTGGSTAVAVALVSGLIITLGWRYQEDVTVATLGLFGGAIATTGTLGFLGFWARGYFKPEQRRLIAIVWDVLTFFPRRFHPLAVRPYAERAVPELTGRLLYHLDAKRAVILSAHSQGTILGVAALSQINQDERTREWLKRVAYVTYGSPLTQLHSRFFPAYFSEELFAELDDALFQGSVTSQSIPGSWRNFYRYTDYIGKYVDLGGISPVRNQIVNDPPEAPIFSRLPFDPMDDAGPDPPRPAWVGLSLHSYYNSDEALKEWIRELRAELERLPT